MRPVKQSGFTFIELLIVMFIIAALAFFGWESMKGWRERNALRMVSQDIKYIFEKYRQKAVDKGYNYGLIFSDDGLYVFEDNGGNSSDPFLGMNNFALDYGEYADSYRGGSPSDMRLYRRVSNPNAEYQFFSGSESRGRLLVMTTDLLNLSNKRTGGVYTPTGTDISSTAVVPFSGGPNAPFESGSIALFFSPEGLVYIKDPTLAINPMQYYNYRLGTKAGATSFYIVRVAYDDPTTNIADVPDYFEIAINRYGASTYVRWHSSDGGASWDAQVQ